MDEIWDSIAEEQGEVEITEAQREEIDRRLLSVPGGPASVGFRGTWSGRAEMGVSRIILDELIDNRQNILDNFQKRKQDLKLYDYLQDYFTKY